MTDHRHNTDRTDGRIVAECPNIDNDPNRHLSIEVEYETAVGDDVLDDLTEAWSECGHCGAELDVIDYREPTEVLTDGGTDTTNDHNE
jgi:hypothetical protein